MKILSFDVGISNLAYCIIEKINNETRIINWDLINLNESHNCCICNKNALYKNNSNYFCKKHSNTEELIFENFYSIHDIDKCSYITCTNNKCTRKSSYKCNTNNEAYCKTHCMQLFKKKCNEMAITKIKKSTLDFNKTLFKLIEILDGLKDLLEVDHVIIENQPSMKNPVMKSISMTIYNYYIIRGVIDNAVKIVKFVSPSSKIKFDTNNNKNENNKKLSYKETKQLSIQYCLNYIENNENDKKWCEFFNSNNKKDDLSDSLLQGLVYLKNQ